MKGPSGRVEVVVEAVLDRGADGDLRAGEQPLHGVGHHVRGRVADDLEPAGSLSRMISSGASAATGVIRSMSIAHPDRDDVFGELSLRSKALAGCQGGSLQSSISWLLSGFVGASGIEPPTPTVSR